MVSGKGNTEEIESNSEGYKGNPEVAYRNP